ncbi:hypothetical protein ACHAWF_004282 [Thalassiosira exigua]
MAALDLAPIAGGGILLQKRILPNSDRSSGPSFGDLRHRSAADGGTSVPCGKASQPFVTGRRGTDIQTTCPNR